jgi:hypothetical protein
VVVLLLAVVVVLVDFCPQISPSWRRTTPSQSAIRGRAAWELAAMQARRGEIQRSLTSLLREVVAVVEIPAAKFVPLVVQAAEVRLVAPLVRMAPLDRAVRVETGLAGLACKAVAAAVEQALLVAMDHLAHQVTAVPGWSGHQDLESITRAVVLEVVTLKEVHTQQALVVLVAAGMEGIVLSNQQAETQQTAKVAVAGLETILMVLQKAEKVARAS